MHSLQGRASGLFLFCFYFVFLFFINPLDYLTFCPGGGDGTWKWHSAPLKGRQSECAAHGCPCHTHGLQCGKVHEEKGYISTLWNTCNCGSKPNAVKEADDGAGWGTGFSGTLVAVLV